MSESPRVLIVSKPIVPPWHDGSKNLVRDVAANLTRARPTVLVTPGAPSVGKRVTMEPVYRDSGRFAPSIVANARVLARLVAGDPHDLWHFVFAPNPASSTAARVAQAARRTMGWRGPIVQTVASAPRSFDGITRWIFGDYVVALTEWTRARMLAGGLHGREVRVIPPCAAAPPAPSQEARKGMRDRHELGSSPIVLYPGDYEVSRGARTVARAVPSIARAVPEALTVFACRAKTAASGPARDAVVAELREEGCLDRTRHVGEVDDMAALLASSSVVVFPVDDLFGKVDVPLVLLEALALGVPLVLAAGGPLEAVDAARHVAPGDSEGIAAEVVRLLSDESAARDLAERGRAEYASRFEPRIVAGQYDELYDDAVAPHSGPCAIP